MFRFGVFLWVTISILGVVHSQEIDASNSDNSKNVRPVRFVPPQDMIQLDVLEIAGVEEFHRLKISQMQAARERVLGIPLKNVSDKPLILANINVGCGCMAAITNELEIKSGDTKMIFLRITPTEVGRFAKKIKISFENAEDITCVIESVVRAAFEITPNSILLNPKVTDGELSINSKFGHMGFEVKSLNPFLSLRYDRKREDGALVYKCWLEKEVNGVKPPKEFIAQIRISHKGKDYEYFLNVLNSTALRIQPEIVFTSRNKQNGDFPEFFVLVGSWLGHDDLVCKIAEPSKSLRLREISRELLSEGSSFKRITFVIEGDVDKVDSLNLNWHRGDEIVGNCQVFVNGRSEIAQDALREINRERNRQLIEQGKATALEPAE